jgi:hypothetical protein
MSSSLYPLFRFKDVAMTPRTPRNPYYPFVPALSFLKSYTCDGKTYSQYLPAANTLDWFTERGMSCTRETAAAAGGCVMRLVSPALREASRAYFGCSDLPGPEVENDDTSVGTRNLINLSVGLPEV